MTWRRNLERKLRRNWGQKSPKWGPKRAPNGAAKQPRGFTVYSGSAKLASGICFEDKNPRNYSTENAVVVINTKETVGRAGKFRWGDTWYVPLENEGLEFSNDRIFSKGMRTKM